MIKFILVSFLYFCTSPLQGSNIQNDIEAMAIIMELGCKGKKYPIPNLSTGRNLMSFYLSLILQSQIL
jgi:hypothetical protein